MSRNCPVKEDLRRDALDRHQLISPLRRKKCIARFTSLLSAYDGVIVGLSDRFELSSTTTHLKKVDEFLIGKTGVEYLEEFYQNDFEDYQRLILHRNIALD